MLLQKRIYIYIAIVRFTIYNIRADLRGRRKDFPNIFFSHSIKFAYICIQFIQPSDLTDNRQTLIITIINLQKTAYEQRRILVRHLQIRLPQEP